MLSIGHWKLQTALNRMSVRNEILDQNMINEIEQKLEAVAAELCRAKRVLFITGAGISADCTTPK